MNTVKISIISAILLLCQAAEGMHRIRQKNQGKSKTTAGQMRDALKGARGKFKKEFTSTVEQATQNEVIGGLTGLREEGQGLVDDLGNAVEVVKAMADDLNMPLEVGLDLAEANLQKTNVKAKYKKQAKDLIAEVRALAPKLMTAGVVAFLMYTYLTMPAQDNQPQTKFQAWKAWAKGQCEPLVGKIGEIGALAWWRGDIKPAIIATPTVPTQTFVVPSQQSWSRWIASWCGHTGS